MKKVIEDVRKLAVTAGTTYFITLPQEMVRSLQWKKGEKKIIKLRKAKIEITDWKGRPAPYGAGRTSSTKKVQTGEK